MHIVFEALMFNMLVFILRQNTSQGQNTPSPNSHTNDNDEYTVILSQPSIISKLLPYNCYISDLGSTDVQVQLDLH